MDAAGGGGYGDPVERDADAVAADVLEGYVTPERAEKDYKVVIDPKTLQLDREKTRQLRRAAPAGR